MELDVNGVSLYYQKTGTGRPMVLVHGNGEDHKIFNRAIPLLARKYTVYALDSRGHGESSPADELHYEDMAEDVLGFLEALNLRDVVYYGFSDGGIIGLLAAAQTDRITDLIVSGANLNPQGMVNWFYATVLALAVFTRNPKYKMMFEEPDISDETLGQIRARTLVLAGKHDLIKETHTRHIAECIPNAELKILPGQTHTSYVVHKPVIAQILLHYLKRAEKNRSSAN